MIGMNLLERKSDGQKEIINLAWAVAMFNQLKLGQEYSLKLDEPDSNLSEGHRTRLLHVLSTLVRQKTIQQLMLVNHHPSLYTSFNNCQTLCLCEDDIVLPAQYNQNVVIK